jgi:hypothetical protein
MSDYAEDLAISRALNRTRDPREMKSLITRRKLVRAALEFEAAMKQHEERNPVGPLRESFPFVIR